MPNSLRRSLVFAVVLFGVVGLGLLRPLPAHAAALTNSTIQEGTDVTAMLDDGGTNLLFSTSNPGYLVRQGVTVQNGSATSAGVSGGDSTNSAARIISNSTISGIDSRGGNLTTLYPQFIIEVY